MRINEKGKTEGRERGIISMAVELASRGGGVTLVISFSLGNNWRPQLVFLPPPPCRCLSLSSFLSATRALQIVRNFVYFAASSRLDERKMAKRHADCLAYANLHRHLAKFTSWQHDERLTRSTSFVRKFNPF